MLELSTPWLYYRTMNKKSEAEKQLIKFRDQLHSLLIEYPEIRINGNSEGLPLAWIRYGEIHNEYTHLHLPTSGRQELISK